MKTPNQYRLVYVRHHYDDTPEPDGKPGSTPYIQTHTKWMSWNGETIRALGSYEIQFRYKENA